MYKPKEQLETFNPRLEELDEKWKTAVSNFNECLASLEEQNKIQKEPEKLVTRCNELVNLNSILHEQGEKTETTKIQEELNSLKSENTTASSKLQEETGNLQKEAGVKDEEVIENMKTMIHRLKKVARGYKAEYDKLKEEEELGNKLAEEKPPEDSAGKDNISKILNEKKKALQDEVEKLTQTSNASKEKEEKSKKTLNSATKRIQPLMSLTDKYSSENAELKNSVEEDRQKKAAMVQAANKRQMRSSVLSTQYEGKQTRKEKELKEKNEELEKYNQEKAKFLEREAAKESAVINTEPGHAERVGGQQLQGPGSKRLRDRESSGEAGRVEQSLKKARTEVEEERLEGETSEIDDEDVLVSTGDENTGDDDEVIQGTGEEQEAREEVGEVAEDVGDPEIVCIDDESGEDEADKDDVIEREIQEEEEEEEDIVEVIDDDMDIKDVSDNVLVTGVSTPSTSSQEQHPQEKSVVTSHTVPSMTQVRLVRSQSHLASFTFAQGQPGNSGFDDSDDCMVPSTPTLFIPKRSDGFGEMISSPHVQHPWFLFGSSAETSLNQTGGLAMGMSEEGLRVDDTRFDIMASTGDADDADLSFDGMEKADKRRVLKAYYKNRDSAKQGRKVIRGKRKQKNDKSVDQEGKTYEAGAL